MIPVVQHLPLFQRPCSGMGFDSTPVRGYGTESITLCFARVDNLIPSADERSAGSAVKAPETEGDLFGLGITVIASSQLRILCQRRPSVASVLVLANPCDFAVSEAPGVNADCHADEPVVMKMSLDEGLLGLEEIIPAILEPHILEDSSIGGVCVDV